MPERLKVRYYCERQECPSDALRRPLPKAILTATAIKTRYRQGSRKSNSGASATVSITTNVITDTTLFATTINLLTGILIPAQWKSVSVIHVTETNTKDELRASEMLALFLVYYYYTTPSIPTRPPRPQIDSQPA